MSHNLDINAGQASFVSARQDAWHQLGTVLPDAFDAASALEYGHLGGWNLRKQPIFTMDENGNRINVPQAKGALDNMKYEIARELGVNLKQGYNGDLTSREAGYVGGYMVKRLIEQAEHQMAGQSW